MVRCGATSSFDTVSLCAAALVRRAPAQKATAVGGFAGLQHVASGPAVDAKARLEVLEAELAELQQQAES